MTRVFPPLIECHSHNGRPARPVRVLGLWRCQEDGHRLTVDGIPPRQTREQPWRAVGELLGRRLAKNAGRKS